MMMYGTQRMYGIARILADFYDTCADLGIAITPDVQLHAREVALAWLRANPLLEPDVRALLAAYDAAQQTQTNRPSAANE